MKARTRRLAAVLAAAVAALTLAAPSWAHFCFKTGWNENAAASAAGSQAWLTAAEWLEFAKSPEVGLCPAGVEIATAYFEAQPATTLFMGPGLLAGGTLKNGKSTPEHFGYLLELFGQVEAACA